MAITLFKLDLRPGDLFMDIGCGTGKVSIHASRQARRVCAIDRRSEAIEYARREAERAGATNIEFVEGNAADLIPDLPRPDAAFLGGSRTWDRTLPSPPPRRNPFHRRQCSEDETSTSAISIMKELGIFREAVLVQVSRASPLGNGHVWKPDHPVAVIVGGNPPC